MRWWLLAVLISCFIPIEVFKLIIGLDTSYFHFCTEWNTWKKIKTLDATQTLSTKAPSSCDWLALMQSQVHIFCSSKVQCTTRPVICYTTWLGIIIHISIRDYFIFDYHWSILYGAPIVIRITFIVGIYHI